MEVDGDNRAACSRCCSAAPLLAAHQVWWGEFGWLCIRQKSVLGSLLLLAAWLPQPHTHTHTPVCVCVAVAAAVAVGQAPLGRSAVGIVCLWVRVGW